MLLHGQATCCDQLHQNEQEKQVHLENINLLAMAENIFLALKGIKPVVLIFFLFFFFFPFQENILPWTQMLSIIMFCTPKNYFFVLFTFVG